MMHCALQLLLSDNLHFAPIGEHPQHVLDIGTGTGIWAMEFGMLKVEIMGVAI